MTSIWLSRFFLLVLLLSAHATAMGSEADFFSFGGFNLRQTPAQLGKIFPLSQVEQSKKIDGNENQSVTIRVNPQEIKDQVTIAQYFLYAEKVQSLQLLFERPLPLGKPGSYFNNQLNQFPACDTVLPSLERAYGKPSGPDIRYSETDVIFHDYVWKQTDQKMTLYCARITDTEGTRTWAMGLTIEPVKDGN